MKTLFPIFETGTSVAQGQPGGTALPLLRDVAMDYDRGVPQFSAGNPVFVTGLEAVKSWAWRAIKTARYRFSFFSWDYGCELDALTGQPYDRDTRQSEAVRYVREALTVCPYITGASVSVEGLDGSKLRIRASVSTVYGKAELDV